MTGVQTCALPIYGCDNVYVGVNNSIKVFDSNWNLAAVYSVPNIIYDLRLSLSGTKLYASGRQFVSQIDLTASTATVTTSSADASDCSVNDGTASVNVSGSTGPYTYLWSNGDTTTSISGLYAGSYIVTVTDTNGCVFMGAALVQCEVGIENYDLQNNMSIYPNPSNGLFVIAGSAKQSLVEVFNVIGENIYSAKSNSNKTEVNLSRQEAGVYFVKVKTADGIAVKKIVKQ